MQPFPKFVLLRCFLRAFPNTELAKHCNTHAHLSLACLTDMYATRPYQHLRLILLSWHQLYCFIFVSFLPSHYLFTEFTEGNAWQAVLISPVRMAGLNYARILNFLWEVCSIYASQNFPKSVSAVNSYSIRKTERLDLNIPQCASQIQPLPA